jgi:excinuclease UvrABC helicase subunit UvrB
LGYARRFFFPLPFRELTGGSKAIQKFKMGEYNVLVSTSIGEEGLDVGEIDLIVCYDAQKSPIRMVCDMLHDCIRRANTIQLQ